MAPTSPSALVRLSASVPEHGALVVASRPLRICFVEADGHLCSVDPTEGAVRELETLAETRRWLRKNPPGVMALSLDGSVRAFEGEAGIWIERVREKRSFLLPSNEVSRLRLIALDPRGDSVVGLARQGAKPWLGSFDAHTGVESFQVPARAGAASRCGRYIAAAVEQDYQTATLQVFERGRLVAEVTRPRTPWIMVFAADPGALWGYDRSGELFCLDLGRSTVTPVTHPFRDIISLVPQIQGRGVWVETWGQEAWTTQPKVPFHGFEAPSEATPDASHPQPTGVNIRQRVLSADGRVVLVDFDGLRALDLASMDTMAVKRAAVHALAAAPGGALICAAHGEGFALLNAQTLAVVRRVVCSSVEVIGVNFSPDGEQIGAIDSAGALHVFGLDGERRWQLSLKEFRERDIESSTLSWSPCGQWIVVSFEANRRHPSFLIDVTSRLVRCLDGVAQMVQSGGGTRIVVLSRNKEGQITVREFAPEQGPEESAIEHYTETASDVDDDMLENLMVSRSGRFVLGRTCEWHRGFVIDRHTKAASSLPFHVSTMTRAQIVDDAWISVGSALDGGLELRSFDLVSLALKEDEICLSTVDKPSAFLFLPGAVFIGDRRGTMARYPFAQ